MCEIGGERGGECEECERTGKGMGEECVKGEWERDMKCEGDECER